MYLICAKDKEAVAKFGYKDISYTMKRPVEHAILSFSLFSLFPKNLQNLQNLQNFLIWKPSQ